MPLYWVPVSHAWHKHANANPVPFIPDDISSTQHVHTSDGLMHTKPTVCKTQQACTLMPMLNERSLQTAATHARYAVLHTGTNNADFEHPSDEDLQQRNGPRTASADDVCYYCKGSGHWKNNCPQKLAGLPPST